MHVAVFGSLNYDLTLWVPHMPAPDETLMADRMEGFCGGKGANQAVAARRAGAEVSMIGAVGTDGHGDILVAALEADGIATTFVQRSSEPTGTAFPIVSPSDVSIIIARGANGSAGAALADQARSVLESADVLLLQGEVPADGAGRAAEIVAASGGRVIFNPAPVDAAVVAAVLPHTSVLIVNRQEQQQIAPPAELTTIVTLGAQGALVNGQELAAFVVDTVVDPTGAGDAFAGAFAVALAEGATLEDATRTGMAAGSLAVQTAGAQPSLPQRSAIDAMLTAGR